MQSAQDRAAPQAPVPGLAERLREARQRIGLTQAQLAEVAGFSAHQIVSQIEKGEREVKAWELARLAHALSVNIQDLLSDAPITQPVVLWRDPPQQRAGVKEAAFLEHYRRFCFVERVTGSAAHIRPPTLRLPVAQLTYRDAADLADAVRQGLGLGDRPAYALLEVAENHYGIQIWYANLDHDGSAASHVDDHGAAVLLSSAEPPWRRNFSFAHELYHILTWDPQHPEEIAALKAVRATFDANEKLANAFASALLLPGEPLRDTLRKALDGGSPIHAVLVAVAGDFGVSLQALLWRLANMGIYPRGQVQMLLTDPDLSALDAASRRGQWWDPPPLPPRFVRLCYLAWQGGHLSRSRLAQYLETDLAGLDARLDQYGLNEPALAEGVDLTSINAYCFSSETEEWPVTVPGA
jgi:Zn-dependent peptidase ImmA (M78 family)/transcriptional regulator with XRE-family HTH domain